MILPPEVRAVVTLRDILGWEISDVAELLDISVASVECRLQQARASTNPDVVTDAVTDFVPTPRRGVLRSG